MTHILTGSCATRTSSAVVESQMESPTSLWSLIGFYFLSWELNSPPDSELVSSVLSHILNLWCIFYVKSDVGWLDCWHRQCLCIKSWKYCISIQLPGNGWAVTFGILNGKREIQDMHPGSCDWRWFVWSRVNDRLWRPFAWSRPHQQVSVYHSTKKHVPSKLPNIS